MSNVPFYSGTKNKKVTLPIDLPRNHGSIFLTSLKESIESLVWPTGYIYMCRVLSIPKSRRLKEDSEPDMARLIELMRASPVYEHILKNEFGGKERFAISAVEQKSRTGAIVEAIREKFYAEEDEVFCRNMVRIGYDGYFGKFKPPANFHTDKKNFYFARLFNHEKIEILTTEETNAVG